MLASILRCQDHPRDPLYLPTTNATGNSLGYFFPRYIKDANVAVCPGTANYIRPALTNPTTAVGADFMYDAKASEIPYDVVSSATRRDTNGHSYEPFGWYSHGVFPDGRTIDGRKVGGYRSQMCLSNPKDPRYAYEDSSTGYSVAHASSSPKNNYFLDVVKRYGHLYGPSSKTILLTDNDEDQYTANKLPMNNWPDVNNNHGNTGANFGFADGHVEFVRRGPAIIQTYLDAYQDPAMNASFLATNYPGLTEDDAYQVNGFAFPKFTIAK